MITQVLESSAVWGVLLTLAAFGLGVLINKRTGQAIFNPLLLGTAFVIVVLSVLKIPYDTYAASASPGQLPAAARNGQPGSAAV